MLHKLKEQGNKYYQFYDDFNNYQARCKNDDPTGYGIMFNDDDDNVHEEVELMKNMRMPFNDEIEKEVMSDEEENDEEKDDIEYETNYPLKKYQFEYNRS